MVASLVLLVCLVAGVVAAGILFVLFGPIPVNRRVTIVALIVPMPTAVGPVAMAGLPVFDPARAAFTPAQPLRVTQPQPVAAVPPPAPRAKPPRPPAPIAPVQLRRPRTTPAPLARTRSARGTEPRRRHAGFDVEHTAAEAPAFELDDPTFIEDVH